MSINFYDKVAGKFGNYHTGARYTKEYLNSDPEKMFKEKLLKIKGKQNVVLDVGCADGRFTLSLAPYFRKIVAIDLSKGMLAAARKLQKETRVKNVTFEKQDAFHTTYDSSTFDVVFSRRGPSNFEESFRVLKSGGYFVEIHIGEKDCQVIKEVFERGQNFGEWHNSLLEKVRNRMRAVGFEVTYSQEFFYNEYYASYEDLDIFLQGVPIFEDFDSKKDKTRLNKYVDRFITKKGIRLPRHRVVTVVQKP